MLLLLTINIYSQSQTPKFGDINLQDFKIDSCTFEENASAIYLFEHGKSEIVYFADDVELKAMIRSNPGLLLMHDGVVLEKWHYNDFPDLSEMEDVITRELTE